MSFKKGKRSRSRIFFIFVVIISVSFTSFVFQGQYASNARSIHDQAQQFSPGSSLYLVQFQETGLPSVSSNSGYGSLWGVNVSGQIHESSTTTIALYLQPGNNISYKVVTLANYSSTPSSGKFNVSASNVVIDISFVPTVYSISFNETGLPSTGSGTEWSITFNGANIYSSTNSISLSEPNGNYSYSISNESIYVPNPTTGIARVNGSSIVIPVQFTNNLESVTFYETGLPLYAGSTVSQWTVELSNATNGIDSAQSSYNNSVTFTVPSGNYSYSVSSIQSYKLIHGSGSVIVAKKYTSVTVAFITSYYGIEFLEAGLPAVTPLWSVSLSNLSSGHEITDYSTQTSLYFNVTNGNYHYKVSSINGYNLLPSSGYVNVTNGFYIINLQYTSTYSTITFKEKGLFSNTTLPHASFGSYWYVTMINSTGYHFVESSDGTSIIFWLLSGTYTYYASNVTGFTTGNETASVQVAGKVTQNITYNLTATLSQSTGVLAAVNLYEFGLNAGTTWSVALSNDTVNATSQITKSALITFYVPSGSYFIRILDSGVMHPNPAYISVSVNTGTETSYNYSINFQSTLGYLNFSETGLFHGTKWSVVVYGSPGSPSTYNSAFANLSIPLLNGTYLYEVIPPSPNINPFGNSSGFVHISSTHSMSFSVSFYSDQYAITFNEHGLPLGASWNLLLTEQSGTIISVPATSGLLNVPLPNGTYRYSALSPSGYLASPALSSFVVNGTSSISTSHNITFAPNKVAVTFMENGLPSGTEWSLTLNGTYEQTDLGSISFFLSGGTYIYHLSSTGIYSPVTSLGVVSVANNNKTVSIQFNPIVSAVSFVESSLPVNTSWSVYVNGHVHVTENQSITILLQNGTYQYQVVEQGNYFPGTPYGVFTVSGQSKTITIGFVDIEYRVSFQESGLPAGVAWTMQILNQTGALTAYTSTSTYNNVSLLNGSYSYNMLEANFYVSIPGNGTFNVNGENQLFSIQYKIFTYTVDFTETGLPAGNTWNISLISDLGTANYSTTTSSSVSFTVVNGTYSFKIESLNKSVAPTPITGTVTVSGSAVNVPVSFNQVLYTASIQESGLPKNTTWEVEINNVTYTSKDNSINVSLINGTYDFTVLNKTSGYTFAPTNGKIIIKGSNITTTITFSPVVTVYHPQPPPPKANYNTFIVLGTLIGIGVVGLGVITVLYFQRKKT